MFSRGELHRSAAVPVAMMLLIATATARAGAQGQQTAPAIDWQDGPVVGQLGNIAQISVPAGYRFTGKAGAQKLLELTQNPSQGNELGAIVPDVADSKDLWFIIFEFNETGYVRDDDQNKLNPGELLKVIREATEESNKIRAQRGWPAFHVADWERQPFYDPQSHNLTWAIRGRVENSGGESVNYSIRVLGRRGTMNVDLVVNPEQVAQVIPAFQKLIGGYSYQAGNRYSEFVKGDKIAGYGLTALIAGAAGAAAVKSGLLAKFWKFLVFVFIAIAGAIKKFFKSLKRLFGGGESAEENQATQG